MQSLQELRSISQLWRKRKKILDKIDFISKIFIDSYFNQYELFRVTNALREYNKMKEEIKNLENALDYTI